MELAKFYNLDAMSAECAVFDKDFGYSHALPGEI